MALVLVVDDGTSLRRMVRLTLEVHVLDDVGEREEPRRDVDRVALRLARRALPVPALEDLRQGVVHAASGPGAPSAPTMQTRQAPNGAMRSSKQSVGT